jgi:hypothetical protein
MAAASALTAYPSTFGMRLHVFMRSYFSLSAKCAIYRTLGLSVNFLSSVSGSATLLENNAFVWPLHTHAPLKTPPFRSDPTFDYVIPFLVILLKARLIPFTFGVERESLFAINTDAIAQDPTHILVPHTGLGSDPASKTFSKTAVNQRPPNSLEDEVVGSSGSTTVNPDASCSNGADSKPFRAAEYVARVVRSYS